MTLVALESQLSAVELELCELIERRRTEIAKVRARLDELDPFARRNHEAEAVIAEAAILFHVVPGDIRGTGKSRSVAHARFVAIALARQRYGWSYPELGRAFGRDHTTCINAVRRAAELGYVLDLEPVRAAG